MLKNMTKTAYLIYSSAAVARLSLHSLGQRWLDIYLITIDGIFYQCCKVK